MRDNILQYKTLDFTMWIIVIKIMDILNPMLDMINDDIPSQDNSDRDNYQKYQPVQFQPTNPYDPDAGIIVMSNCITMVVIWQ